MDDRLPVPDGYLAVGIARKILVMKASFIGAKT